jgi:hypothetical protein
MNDRDQLVESALVSGTPCLKQVGDVFTSRRGHLGVQHDYLGSFPLYSSGMRFTPYMTYRAANQRFKLF